MAVARRAVVDRHVKRKQASILLIDGDRELTTRLRGLFNEAGYEVGVSNSGRAGLDALRTSRPWVVVVDLGLPDLDGLELLRKTQRLPQAPDIVVATGLATPESTGVAVELGAAAYLVKPLDPSRLRDLVDRLCERRRGRKTNPRLVERAHRPRADGQTDTERRRLEVLFDISRRLAAVHDLDQILTLIVNEAEQLLGVEAAGIRLLEGDELVVRARTDSAAAIMARPRLKVGESLTGMVVAEGRPITVEDLVTDTRYDPAHKRGAVERGLHGFLGVPLLAQGAVIGALNVYSRARRRFTPDEISLLCACADQAAIAIDNARLYEDAQTRAARMKRLSELSELVTSSLDLHKVLEFTTKTILDLLDCDFARLWVVDEAAGRLRLATQSSRSQEPEPETGRTEMPLGSGAMGWVVQHRTKRYCADVAEDPIRANAPWFKARGYVSQIAVPLVVGERALGALSVMTKVRRVFSEEEQELLDLFAAKAAAAIENARLHGEAVRRGQQLDALLNAARSVMGGLDLERVLDRILEEAARVARTHHLKVLLVDKDAGVLRVGAVSGGQVPPGFELPLDNSYSGRVATTGEPLFIADILSDPGNLLAARDRELGICTYLGLPIRKGDEVLGVLGFNSTEPRTYSPEELTFLGSFADQAAIAIDNARLYASLERRLSRVRTLSRLNQLVSSSLDMGEVLREITLAAVHLMEVTFASFWVADEAQRTLKMLAFSDPVLGNDFPVRQITFDEGVVGWVAANRQAANISDVTADERTVARDWWHRHGLRSCFAVPVVFEGSLYAVLALHGRRPLRIELDDRDLLDGFVAQAAVAVRNARLFAESERGRSIAEALADVGRALAQSLDVAIISERIAESIRGLLRARSSGVYRVDAKSGDLIVMASTGTLVATFKPNTVLPVGTVAHHAVAERRPIATSNFLADPHVALAAPARARLEPSGHRSVLAVPLIVHDTVIGALGVGDVEGRVFDEEDLRLTQAFADQAAIALENARLYEEAHAQQKQLTQIFDAASDGIMFVRPDGRIEATNRQAAELVGVGDEVVVGADLVELLARQAGPAEADDLFAASLRSLLNSADGDEGDLAIAPLKRVLHWVAKPTHDAAGDIVGLTLTLQDVTKEREVSQMKTDFVSFVTHQLRTPLSGIKWMLELARQQDSVPEEAQAYIDDAHGASERLITLVNDLLDISRLERGKLEVRPRPIDLAALTREVLDDLQPLVRDRNHRIAVAASPDLPLVLADPQLLRQTVLNLTSNAIKYTRPGGEISIRMNREASSALWAIQDNGIGIPKEAQRRLFEKFYRADNVFTIETEGTGLGLYLVRLIVERFGGRVWCESEEGQGATFLFTIPLAEPTDAN